MALTEKTYSLRTKLAIVILILPGVAFYLLRSSIAEWVLWSEEEVLNANVLHPLFNSPEHFAEAYWNPEKMTQRERLQGLTEAYKAAVEALEAVGIEPFLESSSLIGLLRHEGHMPWEVDGDLGVIQSQCEESGATKASLQAAIGANFEVLKFGCRCLEDCEGDNRRMAGRVASKTTGVVIDIFMYAPRSTLEPWQQKLVAEAEAQEWWERVDDHADYTFPLDVLLPLQKGTFEGVKMMLPKDPRAFLSWEYGRCLGVHIWPWRLLLYTDCTIWVILATILKAFVSMLPVTSGDGSSSKSPVVKSSPWITFVTGIYYAVALGIFRNGLAIVALLVVVVCEFLATVIQPGLFGAVAGRIDDMGRVIRSRYRWSQLLLVAILLFELRGSFGQLACQIDDFHLHPMRPKMWTLCLFGKCWDF